jgi:hypothetical protein
VADHHVDRPEVQAQQCVQLTGTNRPTGFDPIRKQADRRFLGKSNDLGVGKDTQERPTVSCAEAGRTTARLRLRSSGLAATAASETPDPIPNSAVKRRGADGTASQDAGE